MLDSFILFQICLIVACVLIQKSSIRRKVAGVFALTVVSHDIAFHTAFEDPYFYYLSAGILDFIVILYIALMSGFSRLSKDIQEISLISIAFNFIGYLIVDEQLLAYNLMYVALYGWAIFTLMRGEPLHDDTQADTLLTLFPTSIFSRFTTNHHKESTKCP